MDFTGIIAEYDPFHNGHAAQLAAVRAAGAQCIAVCMSSGAVQRGGVPILPESVRVRAALDAGADDYLTKPFLMQELLLRVQHLLRRAYRTELRRSRVLTLGDCTVNLQDAAVRRADGTTLALTATERALLQRLADDRGHIVTYDAVCEAVWGADYYGYENSLNVHIRHLREKIEPDPGHPQWLLTVRGIGYRLTGEV